VSEASREHGPEEDVSAASVTVAPPAAGLSGGGLAQELLHLQRHAGNRAVGALLAGRPGRIPPPSRALMRQPKTAEKPSAAVGAVLVFIPDRPLTAHEFAVRVYAQLNGVGLKEAEARVTEVEATGHKTGWGVHYDRGVTADEVGKPMRIQVTLEGYSETEAEDVKGRASQLAGLPQAERQAVDSETDRRFWKKTGDTKQRQLGAGPADAGNRELWMRTRDEVIRDHNRLAALPANVRQFMKLDGRDVTPEQYATVLRIAEKLQSFTDDDWALYKRRVTASTDDYLKLGESIELFLSRQAADRRVAARIGGTENLFRLVKEFRKLEAQGFRTVGGGGAPIQSEAFAKRVEEARTAMNDALAAANFKDVYEFDAACASYLGLFRQRAVELTLLALKASEESVRAELARYQDTGVLTKLFDDQAKLRRLVDEANKAGMRSAPTLQQAQSGVYRPTPEQAAATKEAADARGVRGPAAGRPAGPRPRRARARHDTRGRRGRGGLPRVYPTLSSVPTRRSRLERPASSRKLPGSTVQPPLQCASARSGTGTVATTSSPGSASTTAKPTSQRTGRSTALSGRDA
jgi:hypothetical protein